MYTIIQNPHSIPSASQLNQFQVVQFLINKEKLYNIWSTFMLSSNRARSDYMYFTKYVVREKAFWDNIAYEVYNKVEYWWIIAFFNDIQNPFETLHVGQELNILKNEYIPILLKQVKQLA